MASAAFPDIKLNYSCISPLLSESVNEYLIIFTKLHRIKLELIEKVSSIYNTTAIDLLSGVDLFNKRLSEVTKGKPNSPCESSVKFIHRFLEQIETQAKTLQNLKASFGDCVVTPLNEAVDKKREVWKTCFHYADSFVEQINKKEDDLQKRYKDYSDAAMKVKAGNRKDKQLQIFHDTHNTYLLRLSSVNSINNLLYTHVLPHTMHSIETNHCELNDQVRHHMKYMFSAQKDAMKKMIKSVDKIDHGIDKIDIVGDLNKFIKSTSKSMKDRSPPVFKFSLPKVDQSKIGILENIEAAFIINKRTQPNLQRRLASLQSQTEQLVASISSIRSEDEFEENIRHNSDPALNELIEFLYICDKEANLNVLLKQMELYTPRVIDFLGPMPENLLSEWRHSKKSPKKSISVEPMKEGQRPHEFIEPKMMKPISCFYCGKMIALIGKGFICKVCKLSVHKKCATNVQFCQPMTNSSQFPSEYPSQHGSKYPSQYPSGPPSTNSESVNRKVKGGLDLMKFEPIVMKSSGVYDLIDLESDDDYYDEDEFDDGLSDDDDISINNHAAILQPIKPPILPKPNIINSPDYNAKLNLISSDLFMSAKQNSTSQFTKPPNIHASQSFSGPSLPRKNIHGRSSFDQTICMSPVKSVRPFSTNGKPTIAEKPVLQKPPIKTAKPTILHKTNKVSQSNLCVSLYDYRGTETNDLSFVSGCKIEIIDRSGSDWWEGRANGYQGSFPSKYVLEMKENEKVMHALFTFLKENESEIDVTEGDILVLMHYDEDWAMVRSKDGEGLVPASYVELL